MSGGLMIGCDGFLYERMSGWNTTWWERCYYVGDGLDFTLCEQLKLAPPEKHAAGVHKVIDFNQYLQGKKG